MDNLQKYSQVVFFTRNPHVSHHLALAERMLACYPKEKIVFATFFSKAAAEVEKAGYRLVYLPEELGKYRNTEADPQLVDQIKEEIRSFDPELSLEILLGSERFLPKKKAEQEQFCWQHLAVMHELIQPGTLAMSSMFDHFVYWLAGTLVNQRGGAYFAFNACGIPARSFALKTPWEAWSGPQDDDSDALWAATEARLFEPVEKRIDYMSPRLHRPALRKNLRLYLRNVLRYERNDGRAGSYFSTYPNLLVFLKNWVKAKYRQRSSRSYAYEVNNLSDLEQYEAKEFVFIPLHMEPEATILMYSPWFKDQYELCAAVRKLLPEEVPILVKENPKMRGKRSLEFYRRLKSLPNLKIAAPELPSVPTIQKSKAVVSLAGNVSLEAVFLDVPSIVIGRPPFRKILSASDFAGPKGLDEGALRDWLRDTPLPDPEKVKAEWAEWVRGTLDADSLPVWGGEERHIDSSPKNLDKFLNYMDFCSQS